MPRRNRNAGGVAKQRVRKHGKKLRAPLTPGNFHSAPRMPPRHGQGRGPLR